ncbi:hypothetical protein LXL04_028146 [Taraxacum kok-saghyz]
MTKSVASRVDEVEGEIRAVQSEIELLRDNLQSEISSLKQIMERLLKQRADSPSTSLPHGKIFDPDGPGNPERLNGKGNLDSNPTTVSNHRFRRQKPLRSPTISPETHLRRILASLAASITQFFAPHPQLNHEEFPHPPFFTLLSADARGLFQMPPTRLSNR